ncbi:hypothetical protein [Mesorhizobium sp. BE184]|uniref:hypothetical protein n=1 Tax=Mesorhizobium sp. BE184 TaxID=2817714 RepID=UPI0028665D2E|nr:hypothetical protein [Mesorhizobium sp. BE184]MDR7032150.1 hypothetical protein [Mesorhizobium sp. BE184]
MARTPAENSSKRANESLSLGTDATDRPVRIVLTASAERHAGKEGLGARLAALLLDPAVQVGDVVSILSDSKRHDFSVLRRRWVIESERTELEMTLDHPARPVGR